MESIHQNLVPVLRRLLEPVVEALGLDLVAVEILGSPGKALLRVYIDGPGGISVGQCAKASRAISPVLDVEDPFPGAWELEVSSPGIERPVQRPADFRRFVGFQAKIRLHPGPERRRYTGVLRGVEVDALQGDIVLVEVDGRVERIPFQQIEKAHLDLDDEQFARLGTATASPLEDTQGGFHDQ